MSNKNYLQIIFLLLTTFVQAQVYDWQNPEITFINAEKAHASYVPFNILNWNESQLENSPLVKSLNGTWKFRYFKNPGTIPSDIHNERATAVWYNEK